MCVKEFFFFFFILSSCCVWFLLFPSTRGSSDSIAPRDSLPYWEWRDERFPPPSARSVHAGDESGVRAEPRLIQNPQTVGALIQNRRSVWVQRPQGVSLTVQKSRSFMQKTTFCLFLRFAQILPIHSFTHVDSMSHGYSKGG